MQGVFTEVGISLTEVPPIQLSAGFSCNLVPSIGTYLPEQVDGGGRYVSGFIDQVKINVYGRNGLDVAWTNTLQLTDSALGLLVQCQAVFDALQLFFPLAQDGTPLTEQPIRLLRQSQALVYSKSPEWSYISLVFEVKSKFNIDPEGP